MEKIVANTNSVETILNCSRLMRFGRM